MKPKALLIPFSYPEYPGEVVNKYIRLSEDMLKRIGINFFTTDKVLDYSDITKVIKQARSEDFDFIIANVVSWVEAQNVIGVLDHFKREKICLWSHTTYKEDGEIVTLGPIPAAAILRETMEESDYSFKFVYGMPDSKEVENEILDFAYAGYAISRMKDLRIGLFGYYSMGMYTGGFEHIKVKNKLGPEIIHLDQYLIIKYTEEVKEDEIKELRDKAKKEWEILNTVNNEVLDKTLKMYVALKKLKDEYKLDAMTVKCQYELSRIYKIVPCVPLSLIAEEIPASCEGDVPLILSQIILYYISGNEVVSYGDVHDIIGNGIIIGACGFAPFSKLADKKPKIDKHTALYEGLLTTSPYIEGKVTLNRIASYKDSYKMHIVTGDSVKNPPFHEIGTPLYPCMQVNFDGDLKKFMQDIMSQHYAIVYGNYKDRLIYYCRLIGIKTVEV